MADATKIGVADATKMGVANARVANATQPSEVSGVLVHWVGSGTTVGFMEVFSTDLRPCLPPRWLRPWNSPSPSWLVMGTLVLPYTLLLAENRKH